MGTFYIKRGKNFFPTDNANVIVERLLPAGNYIVNFNQMTNEFSLETIDNFILPSKLYGHNPQQAERILSTFQNRENGTGVMLAGEKGSGKSLLAKVVCVEAAKLAI